jgi:hypothetical protein
VHVARVERVFQDQGLCKVQILWVDQANRCGPWQARRWSFMADASGAQVTEVIPAAEFVCEVSLQGDALTHDSLERLVAAGVPASGVPRRDASLPGPR